MNGGMKCCQLILSAQRNQPTKIYKYIYGQELTFITF